MTKRLKTAGYYSPQHHLVSHLLAPYSVTLITVLTDELGGSGPGARRHGANRTQALLSYLGVVQILQGDPNRKNRLNTQSITLLA